MQIQISWLLQKPADLEIHCLLRQGMSCSAREGLKSYANGADSDKILQTDQGLYCLPRLGQFLDAVTGKLTFKLYDKYDRVLKCPNS